MSKTINVGLIGFGMAGRIFHAPTISCVPQLRLKKIRETKADNSTLIRNRYPDTEIVNDSIAILSDDEIELVIVATPNFTHFSIAKEALLAGKNVVVDKPFTATAAEADELIALAKKQNKLLTVYQNRRWDSDFKTVQKILESGLLGSLAECEIHYDRFRNTLRPNTWKEEDKPGTGLLFDLGSHIIDQAISLFGMPQTVTGFLRNQRSQTKIIDNFEIILDYQQVKVTLKSGFLVKESLPKYILQGNNGSFVKHGLDVQEAALDAGNFSFSASSWGEEPESIWGILNTEYKGVELRGKVKSEKGNYDGYYQNVYKALVGEEELVVKPEQARNTIKIIELAMQSNEQKKTITV